MKKNVKKPNILFITTDQQRKDTIGCYGNSLIHTPNLDRLGEEGIIFERAYCESPICIPSRNTMITGKTAKHHGAGLHNTSMRDSERTIGQVLNENGYDTYFVGKPHFKSQQHKGTEESIADWRAGQYDHWHGPYKGFERIDLILGHSNPLTGHYGQWMEEKYPEARITYMDKNLEALEVTSGQGVYNNDIPEESFSSIYVGDRVCNYLEKMKDKDEPFYCFASFPDPHWPIMPPKELFEMYDNIEVPDITGYNNEADLDNYPRQFRELRDAMEQNARKRNICYDGGGHYMDDESDVLKMIKPYWGAVSLIDKNVGRMMDKLEALELDQNTLIIFTTDHGEYMGAHGMMAKGGFLWEDFINVPFIVKFPQSGIHGIRTEALLSFTDIVPTLLDIANIEQHDMAPDGLSQRRVLEGDTEAIRKVATVHHPCNMEQSINGAAYDTEALSDSGLYPDQYALITDKWKMVYYAGQSNGLLFNLEKDPKELNNLYNTSAYDHIQRTLEKRLLDELIHQNDKQALVNKRGADAYGRHLMTYDVWRSEFDAIMKG